MSVKSKPSTSRQRVGSKIALTAAVPMRASLRAPINSHRAAHVGANVSGVTGVNEFSRAGPLLARPGLAIFTGSEHQQGQARKQDQQADAGQEAYCDPMAN